MQTGRSEVIFADRDVPDFVVEDTLEQPRAGFVARRPHAFERGRSYIEAARLEHERHHGQPSQDIMGCRFGRLP
jgi:hypothetical protein